MSQGKDNQFWLSGQGEKLSAPGRKGIVNTESHSLEKELLSKDSSSFVFSVEIKGRCWYYRVQGV